MLTLGASTAFAAPVDVWIEPVGTVAAVAVASPGTGIYLPFGVDVGLGERWSLTAEASLLMGRWDCPASTTTGCRSRLDGAVFAAGATFHLTGTNDSSGFIVELKSMAAFARESGGLGTTRGLDFYFVPGTASAFGLGLEAGYAVRWRAFYGAILVGATAEYAINTDQSPLSMQLGVFGIQATQRTSGVRGGLDLNFLRVGVTF